MPKAAQGTAKSRTAEGPSSRTTRTARPERPAGNGTGGGGTGTTGTTGTKETTGATGTTSAAGTTSTTKTTNTAGPAVDGVDTRLPGALRAPAAWLRRVPRWWPLPLCLALGALGGTGYAAVAHPQYTATSYVVVSPGGHADAASALGYAQAYGKIATDPVVLARAESTAHLSHGTLRGGIQASTSPDAPMVQITGTSTRPAQAAHYADAVAKSLTHTATKSVKSTGAKLTVLSHSVAPTSPVSPSAPIAVSVGACAGGLIGGLVLLTRPQRRRRPATGAAVPGDNVTAQPEPKR